jgi:hypothetical protein
MSCVVGTNDTLVLSVLFRRQCMARTAESSIAATTCTTDTEFSAARLRVWFDALFNADIRRSNFSSPEDIAPFTLDSTALERRLVPTRVSEPLITALLPAWRTSPWGHVSHSGAVAPYSDANDRRLRLSVGSIAASFILSLRSLWDLVVLLTSDQPQSRVLTEAEKWAPRVGAGELLALWEALRSCSPSTDSQRTGDSVSSLDTCSESSEYARAHFTLVLPGNATNCIGLSDLPLYIAVTAAAWHRSVEGNTSTGSCGTQLQLHVQGGAAYCPAHLEGDEEHSHHRGRIPFSLTDTTSARETAMYTYSLSWTCDEPPTAGTAFVTAHTRVFVFPALNGFAGSVLRIFANVKGLIGEGLLPPVAVSIMAAAVIGPALVPILLPVWFCVAWRRRRGLQ